MERFNGNYHFEYKGPAGPGHGQVSIQDGLISGHDYTQAKYTGMGRIEDDQFVVNFTVDFSGLPGTYSVVTGDPNEAKHSFEFPLPLDFAGEHQMNLATTSGDLWIKIIKQK